MWVTTVVAEGDNNGSLMFGFWTHPLWHAMASDSYLQGQHRLVSDISNGVRYIERERGTKHKRIKATS